MSNHVQKPPFNNDKPANNANLYSSSYLNSITWLEWNNIMAKELNDAGFRRSIWNSSKGCYESVLFATSADNPYSFILGEVSKYEEVEYLKYRNLLNNGRCPSCGNPIIGNPCRYTSGNDKRINYHICLSCAKGHGTIDFNPTEQNKTYSPNNINFSQKDNNSNKEIVPPTVITKTNSIKKWALRLVLFCLITVILCVVSSLIERSLNKVDETIPHRYEVNNAFELKIPNNWYFDPTSCSHYQENTANKDSIKLTANFEDGQLIFVPIGHNITDKLSAAIYVEYRKFDSNLQHLAHYNKQYESANFLKKIMEESLKKNIEMNGFIIDRESIKYCYVRLGENIGFGYYCNIINNENIQTFRYSSHVFWNYDELISITTTYDLNESNKWEKDCKNILNSFNWKHPK